VVDRDFSEFLLTERQIASLLYTEYSCMEMYLFNKTTLAKFFTIFCNKADWPTEDIILSLASVLQELFLIRLANQVLGWKMRFLENLPCMIMVGWSIEFDRDEYLRRYLNKNGRMKEMEDFLGAINSHRLQLSTDARRQIHGHDFVEILCWYLRQKGMSSEFANAKILGRVLAVSVSSDQLEETNLFRCLAERIIV